MSPARRGVYPGSFNPPTHAHLAIADAARRQHGLAEVVLAVSTVALGKEAADRPRLAHRLEVLRAEATARPWLVVWETPLQLIADIAADFEVVVMGADKWVQVNDVGFYTDDGHRDRAVASLPTVAVAPRHGITVDPAFVLDVPDWVAAVSSTAARDGGVEHMSAEARAFDEATGAWTDPARYDRWLAGEA